MGPLEELAVAVGHFLAEEAVLGRSLGVKIETVFVLARHAVYEAIAVLCGPKARSAMKGRERSVPQKRTFVEKTIHRMDTGQGFFFLLEGEVAEEYVSRNTYKLTVELGEGLGEEVAVDVDVEDAGMLMTIFVIFPYLPNIESLTNSSSIASSRTIPTMYTRFR